MKKKLPFNAHTFYSVVADVNAYAQFLQMMSSSKIDDSTRKERHNLKNDRIEGGFDANTTIGFNLVSFTYLSQVSYSTPAMLFPDLMHRYRVTSVSPTATIFEKLESEWIIKGKRQHDWCEIHYKVRLEFASAMFASITKQFFDYFT